MGFLKKLFNDVGDAIKNNVEERKQEICQNIEERKQQFYESIEERKKEVLSKLGVKPEEMMGVYSANEPKQISETKQTTKPEPHKIIQSGVIPTQNNELRDFKRKKMSDLREARDEKDRNRTPENINKWKRVVADIEVIDTALRAGATTFGELKELAKDNASIIVEIDEIQASQLKAKQKQESQKKKEKVRVSFNINGDEGFTRITMYPLIGKECQQTLKNGVEHDRRTGAMEVSQDCIDKLSELLTEKDEQLPLEFLFAHVCTPTELIVTDEESDEEIYNDEYEIDPRYGIMSMDEAVDNYDEEEELKEYKEYLTDTAHTPDDNYISIGIAKTWDKLPESYIEGEGFVPSVIGETLKVASEDDIALLHGETGLSDSTVTFIMEIEDEFDPDKLDFINFDADYSDVSSVLQETLAADYVSMNAIMYDGKMYFAQPQNIDLGENEGDDYYDIVNHHLEGEQEIDIEPESEPKSDENASLIEDSKKESVDDNITDIVQKIKEKLQALDLSSFILYGNDYEGDREYEEVEQLGDEGLLESSSEYAINYNDSYDGNSSVYTKVRKIEIQESGVTFDIEEIYEDNDGDEESRGFHEAQTIDRILESCNRDTVKRGLENILTYLNDETLIKLNKNTENESMPEPVLEPKPEPEADVKVEVEQKEEPIENGGLFSARLEAMISAALQDGVLTDKERELLKRRVEKEGEDWDEVEMIVEARLAEMQPTATVTQVSQTQVQPVVMSSVQESPYLVVNGKEYKDALIDEIDEDILTNVTGLDASDIISVTIPSSVKGIKKNAFFSFYKLKELVIPSSVERIEDEAFGIILSDMSYEKLHINCPIIPENAFNGAPLKEVIFGEGVKKIESTAFANCEELESITLPHSIIEIGGFGWCGGAFQCCKSLKKVDLSQCENLKSIGSYTFCDCTSLSEIDFSSCVSLRDFGGDALSGCPIRILDFSKCKSLDLPWLTKEDLEKVIMPPGQKSFNEIFLWEQSGITVDVSYCNELKQINSECFKEMDMKEIVIPDTVETIGENAFDECEELKTIVMPAALKEIHAPLGSHMEQLKKVDFSKVTQLKLIPKTLFDFGCDKLKELVIPQGVVEIEDDAFLNLTYLKKLFLPPSLTTMGDFDRYSDTPSYKMTVYCYSPHLEELVPLVYGWDDEEDDDDYEDMDEEDMRELGLEPGKNNKIKTTLYVLPQYVDAYTAQRDAECIPNDVLTVLPIPDEYLYYYDN